MKITTKLLLEGELDEPYWVDYRCGITIFYPGKGKIISLGMTLKSLINFMYYRYGEGPHISNTPDRKRYNMFTWNQVFLNNVLYYWANGRDKREVGWDFLINQSNRQEEQIDIVIHRSPL